jgi:hypothetical protein
MPSERAEESGGSAPSARVVLYSMVTDMFVTFRQQHVEWRDIGALERLAMGGHLG